MSDLLAALHFEGGLIPAVAQDARNGAVLMVAWVDREAVERTLQTGEMHYRSRTRGLWHKGATSGNTQAVVSLTPDCDGDALLARVIAKGPACHTGAETCFGPGRSAALESLDATIERRMREQPADSYTVRLLTDRNLRLKKIGEESAELVAALADGDAERATAEVADLLYHALVALRAAGAGWTDVAAELVRRENAATRRK
jgi:phosphoribosyl-ATP pyrophosphohydrolase/phosphoribosyl-AMP cyclohydrolase